MKRGAPGLAVFLLALVVPVAEASPDEARDWLERMSEALATRNYDGLFTHTSGDQTETMRIVHRTENGQSQEVTGQFDLTPLFFSFAVLFWVSGFDIIYAMQDEDFDRNENLHSIPAYLGKVNALRLSTFLHMLSAAFVVMPIFFIDAGILYYIGIAFFCSMLIYQHLLVKPNDLSRVNFAFMTTNGIASVVFAVLFLLDRVV